MADDPQVTVDKLPIKRLEAIEENGNEHYPPEISQEEKPLTLLRRMDFGMSIVKDTKKSKISNESQSAPTWQWQGLVENLHEAQQELSIVLDLINHVEANDAVTVAGMTRPKQLPSEVLSDLAISASTKLQSFRHIGKYLKQTAKALEEQVAREARFYGALMRLQRNWKVKRQRVISAGPGGNAGFTIDLSDNNSTDFMLGLSTSPLSTVHINQDQSGMLAVQLPGRSIHTLHVGFPSGQSGHIMSEHVKKKISSDLFSKDSQQESGAVRQESGKRSSKGISKSVDEGVKEAQSVLREIQCAIFDEQVFDLVIREALHPSPGVNVIGICENFLQLNLGPEVALNIRILPSSSSQEVVQDNEHTEDADVEMIDGDLEWHVDGAPHEEDKGNVTKEDAANIPELHSSVRRLPNPLSSEVFLQHIFHQNVLVGTNSHSSSSARLRFPHKNEGSIKGRETLTAPGLVGSREVDTLGLLRHYCMVLSHRIYCYKVISELENLVQVPYLHLFTHPTWQSRISSWLLYLDIPQMVTHGGQAKVSDWSINKQKLRAQFICKIVVHDESLTIEGEGTPNVGCLFKGSPTGMCSVSEYNCGLSDLASVLLQQVASQLIYWLHEEALVVGMKVERDYLSLSFQLDNSDSLALVASIDQREYCVNWWLILNDTRPDDGLVKHDLVTIGMEKKKACCKSLVGEGGMAMAKVMAKLKGLFRSGNMVGVDKSGNRYFVRTEDVDGALKEKRWVEFKNDSDSTILPVEWISWLTGQRKNAPTAQQMLELQAQRDRVKMNAAILQKEEEKRLFRAKSLQQSMDNGDVGPPNLEKLIQQFSDASVTHHEGEEAQTISQEVHKDADGFRVSEPKGTGDSFQPGTWQPSEFDRLSEPRGTGQSFQPGTWQPPK